MNINAGIVDQWVSGIVERHETDFTARFSVGEDDKTKKRSLAFLSLCVQTLLDLDKEEDALDLITEGGDDFGVDAIEVSDIQEGEFTVNLFQAKYKKSLDGTSAFPENAIAKAVQAVSCLFDPQSRVTLNERLRVRIEDIRSYICRDGKIPHVCFFCCNNGLKWTDAAQRLIDKEERFKNRVTFIHVNHNELIRLRSSSNPVDAVLSFKGKILVEDFSYSRIIIGKIPVAEVKRLIIEYGEKRLLERNIRRFLGFVRVNHAIRETLTDDSQRQNFYFFNNGITLTCSKFDYNTLQEKEHLVRVKGLQVINGGQTCRTIAETLKPLDDLTPFAETCVLVRLYQLPDENSDDLVSRITIATNSQNPVNLRDLHSNDDCQRRLEESINQLGFIYLRQRVRKRFTPQEITSSVAAEAVLAVWCQKPHKVKFQSQEHFDHLYDEIFTGSLSGTHVVLAVLLYRKAETYRKAPPQGSPPFLPYAGAFIAMLMGRLLLRDMDCADENALTHLNFAQAKELVDTRGCDYLRTAVALIEQALARLYVEGTHAPLQQLAATFRRGDLLEYLNGDSMDGAV
ncbi:MAG: AIPR family protein [Kiritimatiellaeota bacterium]|nr:AIPR family protein [Kiritimatiellota bacterium]